MESLSIKENVTENNISSGKNSTVKNILYKIEEGFCIAAMSLMALLPVMEVLAHFIFKTGILGSSTLIAQMLLFTGLLTGMICTRQNEHLSISFVQYIPEGNKLKERLKTLSSLISAFTAAILAWSSVSLIKIGLDDVKIIGFISTQVMALIIPIAYGVISVRFARRAGLTGWKIIFAFLAVILGTAASFPEIVKIIWGGNWEN